MKIIGITGRARSGKDSLASFLTYYHGFRRIALADPLREFVSGITGIAFEELLDGPKKEEPIDWLGGKTPRYLMQTLGTEWGRDKIDREVWLKVAQRSIENAKRSGCIGVVVPDVRFDNEARLIRGLGGEVVSVVRPGNELVLKGWRATAAKVLPKSIHPHLVHPSERGITNVLVDREVVNDGTLADLAIVAESLAL